MDDPEVKMLRIRRRKHRRAITTTAMTLPDDIISDILSICPTKVVIQYRLVCKKWNSLLSSQYFAELHKQKSRPTPMVLATVRKNNVIRNPILIAVSRNLERSTQRIGEINSSNEILFSCDGLLVFLKKDLGKLPKKIRLVNPLINPQKVVRFTIPLSIEAEICGIFFHPLIKEYCVLWRFFTSADGAGFGFGSGRFKMINLGPEPCWRELVTDASICNDYRVAFPNSLPRAPPVIINNVLYWLVQNKNNRVYSDDVTEIIGFDIKRETFSLVPHPEPKENPRRFPLRTYMLNMDDQLSLVETQDIRTSATIHIWILKDFASKIWIKSHTIDIKVSCNLWSRRPVTFVDRELLIFSGACYGGRIFACNLRLGTVRTILKVYLENRNWEFIEGWAHASSLVSLINCKSRIEMPQS